MSLIGFATPTRISPGSWILAPFLGHPADPSRDLNRDIRTGNIILGIAGRNILTVTGDIDESEEVQRSYSDESDQWQTEFFHGPRLTPVRNSIKSIDYL